MTAWLAQTPILKIIDILMGMFTLSFILFALGFFINWLKPSIRSKNIELSFKNSKTPSTLNTCSDRRTLLNHRFFKIMESITTPGYLSFSSVTDKDIINLAFLVDCKFKTFRESMIKFIKELESDEGKSLYTLSQVINETTTAYQSLAEEIKIELTEGKVIYGVPSSYIDKFNKWNSEHLKICLIGISNILNDGLYDDWYMQAMSCLECLCIYFDLTIADAQRTLPTLNGDLEADIKAKVAERII